MHALPLHKRLIASLCALSCAFCGPVVDTAGEDGSDLNYTLVWDDGRVALEDEGWSVTTDEGVQVHLTRGWLVTYQLSLVPCEDPESEPHGHDDDDAHAWRRVFGAGVAHAGHAEDVADPSTWAIPQVEALHAPQGLSVTVSAVAGARYCAAHYLAGRADDATVGLPDEADLDRTTLHLEGTWRDPATGQGGAFKVRTDLANGALREVDLDTGAGPRSVRVSRDLGGLFDGVDFGADDDDAAARRVLTNLVGGVTVEVL